MNIDFTTTEKEEMKAKGYGHLTLVNNDELNEHTNWYISTTDRIGKRFNNGKVLYVKGIVDHQSVTYNTFHEMFTSTPKYIHHDDLFIADGNKVEIDLKNIYNDSQNDCDYQLEYTNAFFDMVNMIRDRKYNVNNNCLINVFHQSQHTVKNYTLSKGVAYNDKTPIPIGYINDVIDYINGTISKLSTELATAVMVHVCNDTDKYCNPKNTSVIIYKDFITNETKTIGTNENKEINIIKNKYGI